MNALLAALAFLTRLPLPARPFDARAQAASLAWYPAVGALLGALLRLLALLLHAWPPLLAAAVLLAAWVALTGALHLDGLADSADAWVGGLGDRERTLAIMKDPRSGPAGVTAVVLVLLLKFAALASLPHPGPALLLAPLLARAALALAFLATPYARAGGLGAALAQAPRGACALGVALAAAVALACGWRGALALAVTAGGFVAWRQACLRRLGGCTGDTCGALAELSETLVLAALAAAG
jgi:adenosylcobinamide-GDP ribazoletransferase